MFFTVLMVLRRYLRWPKEIVSGLRMTGKRNTSGYLKSTGKTVEKLQVLTSLHFFTPKILLSKTK